jgi:hypothetical protein
MTGSEIMTCIVCGLVVFGGSFALAVTAHVNRTAAMQRISEINAGRTYEQISGRSERSKIT